MSTLLAGLHSHPKVKEHNGETVTKVRALTAEDEAFGAAWNANEAMTVVELEDGTELLAKNHEIID